MTPEEVRFVVSAASGLGVGILVAGLITWLLLKHYVPSYLNEKGKNLATKEDVAAITHEVERVRLEYNTLIEEVRARNQLRMAALDKRLQAHQEAFALWRKLTGRSAQPADVIMECQTVVGNRTACTWNPKCARRSLSRITMRACGMNSCASGPRQSSFRRRGPR